MKVLSYVITLIKDWTVLWQENAYISGKSNDIFRK